MLSGEKIHGPDGLKVLLIEDNDAHATAIKKHLRKADRDRIDLQRANRLSIALECIAKCEFDAILLDLSLPDSDMKQTLDRTLAVAKHIPIVILSSLDDKDTALDSVHKGAQEYLCKSDLNGELLLRTIRHAIERNRTEARQRALLKLGDRALSSRDVDALFDQAQRILDEFLQVDCIGIFESGKGQDELTLRHGIGWQKDSIGTETMSGALFQVMMTSAAAGDGDVSERFNEPVIVNNFKQSDQLKDCELLRKHGLISGMAANISGRKKKRPFGFVGVFTNVHRIFDRSEIGFLQSVANTLAAAIRRVGLENNLHAKIEELDQLHRKKDEFLATVSHELRTPLNVIVGYSDLLMTLEPDSEMFQRAVRSIHKSAQDETQLVADLLEVSRIITGKMKLTTELFPVERVVCGAVESVALAAKAKDITLNVDIEHTISQMRADEGRLQQVLWNLLSNSVKFTPMHGRVDFKARRIGSTIAFVVEDNGQGIDPSNMENLFNRFWQEDSSYTRVHSGLGLGLAIVRHVVELHGGTVEAHSDGKGLGARFTVRLPIIGSETLDTQKALTGATEQVAKSPAEGAVGRLSGRKILIVDDNEANLRLTEYLVKKEGAQVCAVVSPLDGLELAKQRDYDVILCDIGMPEMNGYEFIKSWRDWEESEHRDRTPAIALTAYASEHDHRTSLKSGFQNHLAKPCKPNCLTNAIVDLIG